MKTLAELRKALEEKQKGLAALKEKAFADGATKDDLGAYEAALKEIEGILAKIDLLVREEKALAAAAQPADTTTVPPTAPGAVPADVKTNLKPMEKVGLALQGLILGHRKGYGRHAGAAFKALADDLGYAALAQELAIGQKVASTTGVEGALTIADNFNPDIMEMLSPTTAFLRGGPEQIPMPNGGYRQPGQASQPTAAYRGEKQAIATSDLTFNEINMKAKLLSSIVPVTNQIIRYSTAQIVPFVQRSIGTVMGEKMDQKALVGSGVDAEPLGILRMPGHFSTAATNSTTPTAAQVDADTRKLINRFAPYSLLQIRLAWVMTQSRFGYLQDMRDANSNYIYPTLQGSSPTWKGYPVLISAALADNGGVGTNESEIALVSFGNILLGITTAMSFAISEEATVNGVSMFETDQTAVRATAEHDWVARHVQDVARLTAVKWGA